MSMRHPDREQAVIYSWGTPTGLILGRNWIDWNASVNRAIFDRVDAPVCSDCACEMDVPGCHSPRCAA